MASASSATSSAASAPTPPLADADTQQPYFSTLFDVLEQGDDVDALTAVLEVMGISPFVSAVGSAGVGGELCPVDVSDAEGKDHLTPLMKAAKHGRVACATCLISRFGAAVNAVSLRARYTAIGLAAYGGRLEMVHTLLAAGADPRITNRYSESAVRLAEARGQPACAEALRAAAAALDARDAARGLGPPPPAPSPSVGYTLRNGAAVTLRCVRPSDQAGVAALYAAAQRGYMEGEAMAGGSGGVHSAWLQTVLSTDFADVAGHYGSLPRCRFWVATAAPPPSPPPPVVDATASGGGGGPTELLACLDGEGRILVGCVAVLPYVGQHAASATQGSNATTTTAELQRMACHPCMRRCGLASTLLSHAEAWAAASYFTVLHLSTLASMAPALGLYTARGYSRTGESERQFHGHTLRIVEFEKALTAAAGAGSAVAPHPPFGWLVSAAAAAAPSPTPRPAPPAAFPSPDGHGAEYVPRGDVAAAMAAKGAALDGLVARVAAWITAGDIPFPYKAHYTPREQVEAWFRELVALPPSSRAVRLGAYPLHGFLGRDRLVDVVVDGPLVVEAGGGAGWRMTLPGRSMRIGAVGPLALLPPASALVGGGVGSSSISCSAIISVPSFFAAPAAAPTPTAPVPAAFNPFDGSCLHVTSLLGVGPFSLPFDAVFNEPGGHIVDFFSEGARMAAQRREEAGPPCRQWRQPSTALAVAGKAIRKYGQVTEYSLRHGQYGNVPSCNLFHANLARALYGLLGATRILDPCAGWGDRLVGALATPGVVRYLGFDPNPALVGPHREIIEALGCLSPACTADAGGVAGVASAFRVVAAPFEDGVIDGGPEGFNLVLTSPPYFDLEKYDEVGMGGAAVIAAAAAAVAEAEIRSDSSDSGGEASAVAGDHSSGADDSAMCVESGGGGQSMDASGSGLSATTTIPDTSASAAPPPPTTSTTSQSITRHGSSLTQWLEGWYFPMMDKAWAALAPGGHFALYINDHEVAGGGAKRPPPPPSPASASPPPPPPRFEDLDICMPMLTHAATLPACVWVGVLGITGETGKVRPLWLWRKGDVPSPAPPLYAAVADCMRRLAGGGGGAASVSGAAAGSGGVGGRWVPPHQRGGVDASISSSGDNSSTVGTAVSATDSTAGDPIGAPPRKRQMRMDMVRPPDRPPSQQPASSVSLTTGGAAAASQRGGSGGLGGLSLTSAPPRGGFSLTAAATVPSQRPVGGPSLTSPPAAPAIPRKSTAPPPPASATANGSSSGSAGGKPAASAAPPSRDGKWR